jgi:SOS-response transcriptional repressor LexA
MKDMTEIRRINFQEAVARFPSQEAIAERLDVTPGYISQLVTGYRTIGEKTARKFELKLGMKPYTLDKEPDDSGVNDANKGEYIAKVINLPNLSPGPNIRGKVPLISWVKAGEWCEAIDLYSVGDAEDWLPCPAAHGPHTYCLRVKGDSMTNTIPGQKSYPEGTIIFVDPDHPVTNGCRVVAKIYGVNETTFKEYREDGGKRFLKPLNQQYQMLEITDEVIICGVVIFAGMYE